MKKKTAKLHRLRISLVSGPWTDGEECVRFVDVEDRACLYDLHEAIQEAVEFDNEHQFFFFQAEPDGTDRESVPPELGPEPDRKKLDCDVYEEINAAASIPGTGLRSLFYAYLSDGGDWIFEVQDTGTGGDPIPGATYPLQVDSLSSGPNPTQYGHDFDDYAEEEDAFSPRRARDADRWDAGEELLFDEEEDDPLADGGDADEEWRE